MSNLLELSFSLREERLSESINDEALKRDTYARVENKTRRDKRFVELPRRGSRVLALWRKQRGQIVAGCACRTTLACRESTLTRLGCIQIREMTARKWRRGAFLMRSSVYASRLSPAGREDGASASRRSQPAKKQDPALKGETSRFLIKELPLDHERASNRLLYSLSLEVWILSILPFHVWQFLSRRSSGGKCTCRYEIC